MKYSAMATKMSKTRFPSSKTLKIWGETLLQIIRRDTDLCHLAFPEGNSALNYSKNSFSVLQSKKGFLEPHFQGASIIKDILH